MNGPAPEKEALLDQLFGRASIRIALHGIHELAKPERVIGHEALMRGPRGTPYDTPPLAFAMAATLDILERLDCRCIELASAVACDGLLFLNAHPRTIVVSDTFWAAVGNFARSPESVVLEVVEHSPARQDDLLQFNEYEANLSNRRAPETVGRNFFRDVAPCTKVREFHGRFRDGLERGELNVSFDYRFAFKHAPRNVRVTLFYSAPTATVCGCSFRKGAAEWQCRKSTSTRTR